MPDDREAAPSSARDADGRAADHAGIDALIDGLMPALVAKLGALNVGELEVREGDVRIRLRRPAGAEPVLGRRATDRAGGRSHPGSESLGAPGPAPARGESPDATGPESALRVPPRAAHGPMVTSPAVGVFQPGPRAASGTRVRAGDRLGAVDMLGVPQDVLAPADGIIVATLVDAGTAVEYGQELIQLGPAGAAPPVGSVTPTGAAGAEATSPAEGR